MRCSPFLLGGVINEHLKRWESKYPELVKEIRDGLYVDDLMTGGETVEAMAMKRSGAVEILKDGTFKLHKWHSNVATLETKNVSKPSDDEDISYAKQQLGFSKPDTKLLGLPWDKSKDTLSIEIPGKATTTTKRAALSELAKVYDPLGLISPITLIAKQLYREMCENNVTWDGELPEVIKKRWEERQGDISTSITVPRTLAPSFHPITAVTLHGFGDASKIGVSAAVYALVQQGDNTTQGLVCSKSRLAKKSLSIPRLELVAAHMTSNLVSNVERSIDTVKFSSVHCWNDSTVVLYWLNGQGEYRKFVSNRVAKIKERDHIQWHHVPTETNPADLGSRGSKCAENQLWQDGPNWLADPSNWPPNIILEPSPESSAEAKTIKGVFNTTTKTTRVADEFDVLLQAHSLHRVLRIGTWVRRFIDNCRRSINGRNFVPLSTTEIEAERLWWIKRAQGDVADSDEIKEDKTNLNLQMFPEEDCRKCGKWNVFPPRK